MIERLSQKSKADLKLFLKKLHAEYFKVTEPMSTQF